jgi:hypothetical protein
MKAGKPVEVSSLKSAIIGLQGVAGRTQYGKHDAEATEQYGLTVIRSAVLLRQAGMTQEQIGQIVRTFSN